MLTDKSLKCELIRCVDTKQHTICLGKISTQQNSMEIPVMIENDMEEKQFQTTRYFAGIEGGSTHSTLVLIDSSGNKIDEWTGGPSLNCLLNGVERTADQIASWARECIMRKLDLKLPIFSLGMGLSGAEDETTNCRMLKYFKVQHRDLAENFFLTSDSIAAVATSFENGGVVLIAGTGSSCRFLKANGLVHGVGGWGHLIGDGCSAFWITMRAIKRIFDVEDGFILDQQIDFNLESERIVMVKKELLKHFNINNKLELLDILYNPNFDKSLIATFCKRISTLANNGDAFALELFRDGGDIIAQHVCAVSTHFDDEMFDDVPIVLIGSVFNSWRLMKKGFEDRLRRNNTTASAKKQIRHVTLYQLESSPAIGAAILGAKFSAKGMGDVFRKLQTRKKLDEISIL